MKPGLRLCALMAATLTGLAPAPALAAGNCEAWTYTNDGGFEGGQPEAFGICYDAAGNHEASLSVMCAGDVFSVRASLSGEPGQSGDVIYRFPAEQVQMPAVYEAADGMWSATVPVSEPNHNLIWLLRYGPGVLVTGGNEAPVSMPLQNSNAAIEQVIRACR